jgi:hypothetical protein
MVRIDAMVVSSCDENANVERLQLQPAYRSDYPIPNHLATFSAVWALVRFLDGPIKARSASEEPSGRGLADASGFDAGLADASGFDAGLADASGFDAGLADASGFDAGLADASGFDAGLADASGFDAGLADASGFDAGLADASGFHYPGRLPKNLAAPCGAVILETPWQGCYTNPGRENRCCSCRRITVFAARSTDREYPSEYADEEQNQNPDPYRRSSRFLSCRRRGCRAG